MTVSANQIELSKTQLTKGDVVIVYFGANDSKVDTYSQEAMLPFRLIPGYVRILGGLRIKLRLRIADWIWLETVRPADRTLENASRNASNVESLLSKMNKQVTDHEARFIALLQPNIFTKKMYTSKDQKIYNRAKINPRIVKLQYNEYLKALRNKRWFKLTTDSIDTHPGTPYLDSWHLDSSGNELVANSIFELIKGDLSEKHV